MLVFIAFDLTGLTSHFTKFKAYLLGTETQTINTGIKLLNNISIPPAVLSPMLVFFVSSSMQDKVRRQTLFSPWGIRVPEIKSNGNWKKICAETEKIE